MDIEFTEDMPKKWLDDMLGKLDPIEGEAATPKKEKTPKKTKPATRGRRKKEEEPEYDGPEEEEPEEAIEYAEDLGVCWNKQDITPSSSSCASPPSPSPACQCIHQGCRKSPRFCPSVPP